MNAAASSWWTSTNRTLSWWRRSPSMIPLIPSPGSPNTVSTPHSASRSTSSSDAILSMRTPSVARRTGQSPGGLATLRARETAAGRVRRPGRSASWPLPSERTPGRPAASGRREAPGRAVPPVGGRLQTGVAAQQAVVEGGVAVAVAGGADGLGQGAAGADQHHQLLGPADGGVEQVALEHEPGRLDHGHDHARVLAALGAVHGQGVGVGELVEVVEPVADLLVLVHEHEQLMGLGRDGGDGADRPVEHALLVVVADLHHLVAGPVGAAGETAL